MAAIKDQKTLHANRCRVIIDGFTLAEGQNVQVQESGGTNAVRVIGSEYAQEHVHNAYDVSVTVGALRFKVSTMAKLNLGNGPLVDLPEFEVKIYDDLTKKLMLVVRRCTFASRSLSVSASQPMQRNVQIMGITAKDS